MSLVKRDKWTDPLVLGVWFGLLSGFCQISILLFKKMVLHQSILFGPHIIWMAPLADAVLYAAGGVFIVVFNCWRRSSPSLTGISVFIFLLFLSVVSAYASLHILAAILLALGLTIQTVRWLKNYLGAMAAMTRRTLPWLAALVMCLAIAVYSWQALTERVAIANLSKPKPSASNIILIVLDTVRAQNLSVYGYPRRTTPQLEHFAQKSVVFDRAISTAPWTTPSHASMFTGQLPQELSINWWTTPLDNPTPTLAERLAAHGYATAGFVANVVYAGWETGLSRGFAHYDDYQVSFGELILSSSIATLIANSHRVRRLFGYYDILGRKTAETINGEFLNWVSDHPSRPFFAFLNYYDAHEPYLPPTPFNTKFAHDNWEVKPLIRYWGHEAGRLPSETLSPEQIRAEIDSYDNAIAYLDHQLGVLFAELDKRHLLEKTLIIVTSDHGEAFGENGVFSHGNSLYRSVIQVPLLMSFPSHLPAGKRIQDVVSLRDLPSTILDLLQVKAPNLPGNSLVQYWNPQRAKNVQEPVAVSVLRSDGSSTASQWRGAKQSIVSAGQHYVRNGDGREELYDWASDPKEMVNLAISQKTFNQLRCFREYISQIFGPKNIHQASLE